MSGLRWSHASSCGLLLALLLQGAIACECPPPEEPFTPLGLEVGPEHDRTHSFKPFVLTGRFSRTANAAYTGPYREASLWILRAANVDSFLRRTGEWTSAVPDSLQPSAPVGVWFARAERVYNPQDGTREWRRYDEDLFPALVPGDRVSLRKGPLGFEGTPNGIIVRDAAGVKYVYDDAGYGQAFRDGRAGPFRLHLGQRYCESEGMNYPFLVVSAPADTVRLHQGQSATLQYQGATYDVHALAVWAFKGHPTDVPQATYRYIIKRR